MFDGFMNGILCFVVLQYKFLFISPPKRLFCDLDRGMAKSNILGSKPGYLDQLKRWLEPVVRSSRTSQWHRCWHGKTDGFAASTFHSLCDNQGPTVTIVRVGNYVFGGYTDQSWGK